jgi:predicted ArsR family transcriptional regulator
MQKIKNVESGLKVRTILLGILEKCASDAVGIAKVTSLSYRVVLHHLKLLENEGVLSRKGQRPYVWSLTGIGQSRLIG